MGYHRAVSCLAVALQVRGGSKYACVSRGITSILAARRLAPRISRMGFDSTGSAVCDFAVVLDWLALRAVGESPRESQRDEWAMDCAPFFHRHLCDGIIDTGKSGRLYELHFFGPRCLGDCCDHVEGVPFS